MENREPRTFPYIVHSCDLLREVSGGYIQDVGERRAGVGGEGPGPGVPGRGVVGAQ